MTTPHPPTPDPTPDQAPGKARLAPEPVPELVPLPVPLGRRALAAGWGNRPSLGAWAMLLGLPGGTQLAFGCPWWWIAAVQWPAYAALWLALTIADTRHTARTTARYRGRRPGRGHRMSTVLSGTGSKESRS
jgi:hypothetical protein